MSKLRKQKWLRLLSVLFAVVLCFGTAGSVSAEDSDYTEEEILQLLEGKTAGVLSGSTQDKIILSKLPGTEIQYINNATDVALALETNKVDFFAFPTVNYYIMAQQYPDLGYLDVDLATYDIGAVFAKSERGDTIRNQLNEYIAKLKENGELERLQDYWLYPKDWESVDIPTTGENGMITLATGCDLKPFSFYVNGEYAGYEFDIMAGFCKEYGYGINVEVVEFTGTLSGIITGKYDVAIGQISMTDERKESVNFSDVYYTQTFVPLVNSKNFDTPALVTTNTGDETSSDSSASSGESGTSQNALWTSIRRTLLDENRWASLLQGLTVTLWITIAGFILSNIIGALFCAMSMSNSKPLKVISGIYSGLMQGLPVVVILMILYYIIFGSSKVSNVTVAILGFGMVFGANMAQLFEGGIGSVEKGQWEAALAVGLTKRQAFFGIVLPQAVRQMLSGYFSNLISLMKGTAIVGYIAITDLTKAGDIIRSNTYEAFVPLIVVALCYFLVAFIFILFMNLIRKKLSRKHGQKINNSEKTAGGERA